MVTLPENWSEAGAPAWIVEQYRARNPVFFARDGHEVGVQVVPVSTSSPHDAERFEVDAVLGDVEAFREAMEIEVFEERERALERAVQFARRYEDVVGARGGGRAAVESAVEHVSP